MRPKKATEADLIALARKRPRCLARPTTAKLLADNATLMRFWVPEVLEKVATVLTDKDTIAREIDRQKSA